MQWWFRPHCCLLADRSALQPQPTRLGLFFLQSQMVQLVPPAIELSGLTFQWPGTTRPLLAIADWSVAPGRLVFLQGPSGSGKSTLLSLLAGVERPSGGSCRVLEHSFHVLTGAQRDRVRAASIGVIFQQFNLLPYLSALENVLLPSRIANRPPAHAPQELLQRLGLAPTLWEQAANRLSVGQQQRVAAARALVLGPKLLLTDEPTSALDAAHQRAFLRLVLELARSAAITVVMVSHDSRMADVFDESWRLTEAGGLEVAV